MGVDERYRQSLTELSSARERLRDAGHLSGSDGGGTSDGMEQRVGRLERQQEQLAKDLTDLRVAVATLAERAAHLPGKGFTVTATSTTIALIGALVLFADKVRALIAG